jgi:D-alanyl-D-alanine carboxypeptidase (penicillin-binding protein 5/6)
VFLHPMMRKAATLGTIAALYTAVPTAYAFTTKAEYAYLMDVNTGDVLLDKNSDVAMAPSSMSKLMTVYMVFERLKDGSLSLDEEFRVSANAWRKGGVRSGSSTMFLEPNTTVSVEKLLRGIVIQSGNDACITIAENLAGSEEAFANMMNQKAQELGLTSSHFKNATGLPDPEHMMSAQDLAKLANILIHKFPEYYGLFSERSFSYNGIKQANRNPLLYPEFAGADGLKTGHTDVAGYGLTASAEQRGRRLVMVINGLKTAKDRSREARALLAWGFRNFNNFDLFKAGEIVENADIWLGEDEQVPLVIQNDVSVTLPRNALRTMKVKVTYNGPLEAPIQSGQELAKLVVSAPNVPDKTFPLYAAKDVAKLGFVDRLLSKVSTLIWGKA